MKNIHISLIGLTTLTPIEAPSEIPISQLAKTIPRQSSLPKKTTMNSLMKRTCTIIE